ncbi:hypothetical protein Bca52824_069372 [Brassica carinata]|uniref:Mitochondrial transcription termination factor family protein n=1 Tax=Brassica carinata TaxID=52824 RepID=A0A8X7Q5Q6_BRACI|nr:hypothetical protein Bca52824_069372 [Brassica carinata]
MFSPLILHGRRRSTELHRCCNSTILLNLLQTASAFSSYSLEDGRKGKTFTVSYLVDSLGLAKKLAESVSFEDKGKPDSVLSLLRSHGFTNSHISSIVTDYPQLLISDAERSLAPKLRFLKSRGASSFELTETLSKVPRILGMKEEKSISIYYDFVRDVIEADKSSKYKRVCLSSLPQGIKQENKLRNVSALRDLGVPQRLLLPLLISDHQLLCGDGKFKESLKKVVEMGFDPTTSKFVKALRIVQRFSNKAIEDKVSFCVRLGFDVDDVWAMFKKYPPFLNNSEKKISQTVETLKKCGLHQDEILSLFEKFPQCISYSEQKMEKAIATLLCLGFSKGDLAMILKRLPQCIGLSAESVKEKTEFLVKEMNWSLKAVVSTPAVLGYSLEKRTVPRCDVIKALMTRGLLGNEPPTMSPVLAITDEAFLNKYVRKHDDKELVAELMATFNGKKRKNKQSL